MSKTVDLLSPIRGRDIAMMIAHMSEDGRGVSYIKHQVLFIVDSPYIH